MPCSIISAFSRSIACVSVKPLIGPLQQGPSDAAVIRPKLDSFKGVAIACGLAPHIENPYQMAIASIEEAIRNAVCVGADPRKLAMLDNFTYPADIFPSSRFYADDLGRPELELTSGPDGTPHVAASREPGIGAEPDAGLLARLTKQKARLAA